MQVDDDPTDGGMWLFSYGTLRQPEVQHAMFGRTLAEVPDALAGYRAEVVEIADAAVVATSGSAWHPILRATGDPADVIAGAALSIVMDDLPAADAYETDAYRRIRVTLRSGRQAFVYVG